MGFCPSTGQCSVGILNDVVRFSMLASACTTPTPVSHTHGVLNSQWEVDGSKFNQVGEKSSLYVRRDSCRFALASWGWPGECLFTSNPNTKVQSCVNPLSAGINVPNKQLDESLSFSLCGVQGLGQDQARTSSATAAHLGPRATTRIPPTRYGTIQFP